MKHNRWIVAVIAAINICILCGCVFWLMREDNTAPEFRFQTSDYTWLRSDGEELLLQNIIAYDDRDGNITDRIVIEKIVENEDNNTAVVYYAVSDLAGNVAKVSRIFPMEPSDEVPSYVAERQEEADGAEEETADASDGTTTDSNDSEEEETAAEETEEDADPEAEEEDDEKEEAAAGTDTAGAADPEPANPTVDRSGYPVLILKKNEVTIEAGTSPPWTELIETMRDDKDDYTTLYYNLHISKFNSGRTGDYPVTLQAEDSDGNLSDPVTVTVHVR